MNVHGSPKGIAACKEANYFRAHSPHWQQLRFWSKVDQSGDCWIWRGTKQASGHGRFGIRGLTMRLAHRVSYEWLVGPIPSGLCLDHLCGVPACVNPEHLEPVTNATNVMRGNSVPSLNARKSHCKRGHSHWRMATQHVNGKPRRICVPCVQAYDRARKPRGRKRAA